MIPLLSKALPLCILFCGIIMSKRIRAPDLSFNTEKLDECRRCKVLTDSFNHWLEKTSRGKYEGGDAAWEEAKLKSYARSEIRLVEIQEGLCSELKKHQDPCYTLAEEAEQVLETWWFKEDSNSIDLYSWLCIDTLHYCCPNNHFGEICSPCLLDKNNKVCSGNGQCDGEGTRKGNGTCLCKRGYIGMLCDNCADNFYLEDSTCQPCHRACKGCSGYGPVACEECNPGWILQERECVDVNECLSSSTCKENEFCVNKEGYYRCKPCDKKCHTCNGEGPANCTSCENKNVLWSGVCIDEDQKEELISNTLRKLILYVGMLLITAFVFRTSKTVASMVIIIISIYIYVSERSLNVNLLDVIVHILL